MFEGGDVIVCDVLIGYCVYFFVVKVVVCEYVLVVEIVLSVICSYVFVIIL